MNSRLSTYNTGKHPDNKHEPYYMKKCINYRIIEEYFKSAFKSFRVEEEKELYNMYLCDIENYLNKFIDVEEELLINKLKLNNDEIRSQLFNNLLLPPQNRKPLKITREITTNNIIDKIVLDDLNREEFNNIIVQAYDNLEDKNNIKRKILETVFDSKGYKIKRKRNVWSTSINVLKKVNPNIKFKY